jgi:hypothetical protein
MSTALSPKLARLVRNIGKGIVMRFSGEPFGKAAYIAELERELRGHNLNHPEFICDIARTYVRLDLAERARHDPFAVNPDTGDLDITLFDPADFAKGIIRLGNGMNVRMADATAQQWVSRQLHQQQAAAAAQQAATKTTLFLQTEPGVMLLENPLLRTFEAMRQLSLWDIDEIVHEDENEDGGGDDEE